MVNDRERLVMFKTDKIKAEYLCMNGNCTNGSTYYVVDPENGTLLPMLETDMLYLAVQAHSVHGISRNRQWIRFETK